MSCNGRGPAAEEAVDVLGIVVMDGSLGGKGGGELSSSPASGVIGRRRLEEVESGALAEGDRLGVGGTSSLALLEHRERPCWECVERKEAIDDFLDFAMVESVRVSGEGESSSSLERDVSSSVRRMTLVTDLSLQPSPVVNPMPPFNSFPSR